MKLITYFTLAGFAFAGKKDSSKCSALKAADVSSYLPSDPSHYVVKKNKRVQCSKPVKGNSNLKRDREAKKEWKKFIGSGARVGFVCKKGNWKIAGGAAAPECPGNADGAWENFFGESSCTNGDGVWGFGNKGTTECGKCDSEFVLENGVCNPAPVKSQCSCNNGTGVVDFDCNNGAKTECEKCNAGYTMDTSGSCVMPVSGARITSHKVFNTEAELKEYCKDSVFDLTIIVDGSGSVWPTNYAKSVDWVASLLRPFNISPSSARVTLMQYSWSLRYYTTFSTDASGVASAITSMRNTQYRSGTMTNKALMNAGATIKAHGRKNVQQYVIVLTDGYSADSVRYANQLHADGISVFALGIGRGAYGPQMNALASDPDAEYRYIISDFNSLNNVWIKMTIGSNVCINADKMSVVGRNVIAPARKQAYEVKNNDVEEGDAMTEEDVEGLEY